MSSLKLFISHNEKSGDAANKIKNELSYQCDVIFIEDFVECGDYEIINQGDVIHFSCNSDLIYTVIENIKDKDCFIFNKNFILKRYDKLSLQLLLKESDINVPKIYNTLSEIKLPVFCKQTRHTGIIFKVFTLSAINYFFSKFKEENFYFEEDVLKPQSIENKYYYSNGKIHARNQKKVPKEVKDICQKVNQNFDIDIYSIDIIKTENGIFVIDLNPAVGFYLSDKGRMDFIKTVEDKLGD